MDDKEFGAKLKALRTSAKKTVPEISQYLTDLGVKASEKTIYSWEAGRSQPAPDTLLEICNFYGVSDILLAFGYKKEDPPGVDAEEVSENERLFTSLPRELRQEALRYLRYLSEREGKQ